MQRATLLFPLALFLTPGTGSRDTLAWKPTEGTLVRIFETSSESELEGLGMFLDGEERENPHGGGPPQMMIKSAERNVFVDEILEADDERVLHFKRTFRELSQTRTMESELAPEPTEEERISDLEETTVVFKWDADEEEYELEFELDEGLDESLLEHLVEDTTLRGFLPEEEVEEGDSWEVDIEAYINAMWPGGVLGFYEEQAGPDEQRLEMTLALLEEVQGSIEATYQGTREEDGVRVAVIEVEIEAKTSAEAEMEDERMGEYTQFVSLERTVEGEILWDLEGQRLYGFFGEAEGEEVNEMRSTVEGPDGEEHDVARRMTYVGTTKYSFTLEEEE